MGNDKEKIVLKLKGRLIPIRDKEIQKRLNEILNDQIRKLEGEIKEIEKASGKEILEISGKKEDRKTDKVKEVIREYFYKEIEEIISEIIKKDNAMIETVAEEFAKSKEWEDVKVENEAKEYAKKCLGEILTEAKVKTSGLFVSNSLETSDEEQVNIITNNNPREKFISDAADNLKNISEENVKYLGYFYDVAEAAATAGCTFGREAKYTETDRYNEDGTPNKEGKYSARYLNLKSKIDERKAIEKILNAKFFETVKEVMIAEFQATLAESFDFEKLFGDEEQGNSVSTFNKKTFNQDALSKLENYNTTTQKESESDVEYKARLDQAKNDYESEITNRKGKAFKRVCTLYGNIIEKYKDILSRFEETQITEIAIALNDKIKTRVSSLLDEAKNANGSPFKPGIVVTDDDLEKYKQQNKEYKVKADMLLGFRKMWCSKANAQAEENDKKNYGVNFIEDTFAKNVIAEKMKRLDEDIKMVTEESNNVSTNQTSVETTINEMKTELEKKRKEFAAALKGYLVTNQPQNPEVKKTKEQTKKEGKLNSDIEALVGKFDKLYKKVIENLNKTGKLEKYNIRIKELGILTANTESVKEELFNKFKKMIKELSEEKDLSNLENSELESMEKILEDLGCEGFLKALKEKTPAKVNADENVPPQPSTEE